MPLLTIQRFFIDELIPALCRTFAHSLWQGLLLAIIAAMVLVATKRSTLRYNLLTGAVLLFVVGIIITFCIQLSGSTTVPHLANAITIDQSRTNNVSTSIIHAQGPISIGSTVIAGIDSHANAIAFAWFLIFLIKAIRFSMGLYSLHKIKRVDTSDAGEYWNERLLVLSARLRVSKPVRLIRSGIATVPVVLGYFKPVILFPAALLTSLPVAEVEAVLLHELAHVRRRDYLVNLLQQVIESVFFFNPAMIWVSSLIRVERENCCDDIALSQTSNNKINYINALIAFQEYRLSPPQYAPALMGKKHQLLSRVKRIIHNNNKTLNAMEKIFLTAGIAVAGFLAIAFSPGRSADQHHASPPTALAKSMTTKTDPVQLLRKDTIPLPPKNLTSIGLDNINTVVDGKRYELQLNNDEITALSIDGQKIKNDKIANYKATTDLIIRQAKENIAREKLMSEKALMAADHAKTDAELSTLMAEKTEKEAALSKVNSDRSLMLLQKLKEENALQLKLKNEQTLQLLGQLKGNLSMTESQDKNAAILLEKLTTRQSLSDAALSKTLTEKLQAQTLANVALSKTLNEKLQTLTLADTKNQLVLAQIESEFAKKDATRSLIDARLSLQLAEEAKASTQLSMKKDKELALNARTTSSEIINDLIRDKIIKDKKNISFSLNKDALIVNGLKQPDAVFQKFREKYVKTEDWNFNYKE